jgi:hypothetical protein
LPRWPPDDVVEDLADVLRLLERRKDRVDGRRADVVAALDQIGELVDHGPGLLDVRLVALDRQPVSAQDDRAPEPVAQGAEHAVADRGQLGRNLVRDRENLLHRGLSVGTARAPSPPSRAPVAEPPRACRPEGKLRNCHAAITPV